MKFPESLQLLTDTLWQIETKEDFSAALEDLLTPSEIVDVADRITLLGMLKEGKSQREIADSMGISVTTVSRGSRVLKYGRGCIEKYV